jgi:urease accessory protein
MPSPNCIAISGHSHDGPPACFARDPPRGRAARSDDAAPAAVSWHGQLVLTYRRDGARTHAHDRHDGPLRVLKALYPEGAGVCHHVLVHPPGGMAGGDTLDIDVQVGPGAHALITSAGAARFYRSETAAQAQHARMTLAADARLEWLPLETIAFPGCRAVNAVQFTLEPGAQCLGWDLLALGLPAAGAMFDHGAITQRLHWPGVWLEHGRIAADDTALLDSPVGLDGERALATLWLASHPPWPPALREALLDAAREAVQRHGLDARAGATSPDQRLVLLRALAPRIEPLFALCTDVRAAWRRVAWQLDAPPPRIWRT